MVSRARIIVLAQRARAGHAPGAGRGGGRCWSVLVVLRRLRSGARGEGAPPARGRPRRDVRRARDEPRLPAAVRGAVPGERRAEPAPPLDCGLRVARARAPRCAWRAATACADRGEDVTFPGAAFAPTRVHGRRRGARPRSGCRAPGAAAAIPCAGAPPPSCSAGRRGAGARSGCPAFASGGGYEGPLAYRMGKPMRPDVAAAFDRLAAAARREAGLAPVGHERLPLGRRAGAPVRRQPQPEVGGAAGHEPPPLRDGARPRPARRLRLAGTPTRGASASSSATRGSPGTSATGPTRATAPTRRSTSAARGSRRAATTPASTTACRASSRRASTTRSPGAALRWNVPMNLLAAQLYAESGFNPFATSPAGARRASPSSCRAPPAPTASATRSTPSRRSTPRRT